LGRRVLAALVAQVNAAVFLVGYTALVAGVAARAGAPVAAIVGGGVLMLVAVWPYLRPRKG
jgi:hypothetical protein